MARSPRGNESASGTPCLHIESRCRDGHGVGTGHPHRGRASENRLVRIRHRAGLLTFARRGHDRVTASNIVALPLLLIAMYPAAYTLAQKLVGVPESMFSLPYLVFCLWTPCRFANAEACHTLVARRAVDRLDHPAGVICRGHWSSLLVAGWLLSVDGCCNESHFGASFGPTRERLDAGRVSPHARWNGSAGYSRGSLRPHD